MKDESGSYAALIELGSSASQMMAAKVLDVLFQASRMRRTCKRRSVSLLPSQNEGRVNSY